MDTLQMIFAVGYLAGILLGFVSLFYLKDGLPEGFYNFKGSRRRLREYYRPPGYVLWMWGIGLVVVGLLGNMVVQTRISPGLSSAVPFDIILIVAGCLAAGLSFIWYQPGKLSSAEQRDVSGLDKLRRSYRPPGYRLAWTGILFLGMGVVALFFTRVL